MHSGHRQRMRDRIRENGEQSLSDHEFLEVLLYITQPRVNTNEQAHPGGAGKPCGLCRFGP